MNHTRREFLTLAAAMGASMVVPAVVPAIAQETPTTRPAMLTRKIPSSGEAIPAIGMGTWQTFDENPSDADAMKRLGEVLKTFHDAGGRVVDSSPMYGRSESVTGKVSTDLGINDDLFIATKVWTRGQDAGIEQMRDSMQKLNRKKLELMQIHNLVDWQTHLKTLRAWKDEGKFRYIGITHYLNSAFDDLEAIIRNEKIDFVQLPYSVDATDADQRLIPAARDKGVAVLMMRPFGGGGLFGKVRGKDLPEHAKAYAGSWAQAFLKFVLANDSITAALPATSKPHHMADNVQAGTGRLPDQRERQLLIEAVRA